MPGSQLRFLVVEDHDFQRAVLVQLLQSLGAAAVHAAEDGRAALRVLRDPDRPVDIVISDLSMPGMDGMEFVRHLSQAGSRVSLILASSLAPELLAAVANMAQAYSVKLLGVIGKPATAVKLVPLLQQHRQESPRPGEPDSQFGLADIAEGWTHNEFEPWFEPQVDLATGEVRAMHARPRWRQTGGQLLDGPAFLPSIRARGLHEDFAWLMLQRSAARCREWRERGVAATVWINLLFESWADVKLATRVREIVEKEELEPSSVVLALSEPALATDARALENLARLRIDGFGLALDDFGTGAMEIDKVSLVAFTHLRIRNEFVAGVDRDESARAGLAVALDVANQLKLRTVADGIARKEEWVLLHEWGCKLGQGPLISGPIEAGAVAEWARKWSASRRG